MSLPAPKLFVLDTNVVLHDAGCIDNFEENDIAIPITVLEELDKFKRGSEDIHFQAREFLRMLDAVTGPLLSDEGASRGDNLGNIRVVIGGPLDDRIYTAFFQDSPDHRILNTTLRLTRENADRVVILVSKDINLRAFTCNNLPLKKISKSLEVMPLFGGGVFHRRLSMQ